MMDRPHTLPKNIPPGLTGSFSSAQSPVDPHLDEGGLVSLPRKPGSTSGEGELGS